MKFPRSLGIVAYGSYIPRFVLPSQEIEAAQNNEKSGIPQSLGVKQKTVPEIDEDTTTLAVEAARQALMRWQKSKNSEVNSIEKIDGIKEIGALFIGSESHPYAVKPTGTMVKEALGLSDQLALADLQFACKAGTQALQIIAAYVGSEMISAGLAIGADTAQSRPGDVLEFTAGAGAAAFVLGTKKVLATLKASVSVATDTPDFWRRPGQAYPQHAGRFSGEPAYFQHVSQATKLLLSETKMKPADVDWCVFHTPNAKFPMAVAKQLGFSSRQLEHSLVVQEIGNTYAAASLLGLVSVLDHAQPHQSILLTSYGSGAGADSFLFETTSELLQQRKNWTAKLADQIEKTTAISYEMYRGNTQGNH